MAQTYESYTIQEMRPKANNLLKTPGVAKKIAMESRTVAIVRDGKASKRQRPSHGDRARRFRLTPCSVDVSEDALTIKSIAAVKDRIKTL